MLILGNDMSITQAWLVVPGLAHRSINAITLLFLAATAEHAMVSASAVDRPNLYLYKSLAESICGGLTNGARYYVDMMENIY